MKQLRYVILLELFFLVILVQRGCRLQINHTNSNHGNRLSTTTHFEAFSETTLSSEKLYRNLHNQLCCEELALLFHLNCHWICSYHLLQKFEGF